MSLSHLYRYHITIVNDILHGCSNPFVHPRAYAKGNNANSTESEGKLRARCTLEGWQWIVVGHDEHSLHNNEIVVKTDNGIEQCYEHRGISQSTNSSTDL